MKLSRVHIIIFTLLMAVIVLWFTNPARYTDQPSATHQLGKDYSWQAMKTTVWTVTPNQTDKQNIVQAEQVLYRNEGKLSEFTKPRAYIIENDTTTSLSSDKGWSENDDLLHFEDQVVVTQKHQQEEPTLTQLRTERLHYNVEQQTAFTNSNVDIQLKSGTITGQGLTADLKNQNFEILNNVNSVLYPAEK